MIPFLKRILIVDDERRMCDSLMTLLNAQGYYLKTCCNGNDAMACLMAENFDLVLLDIAMEQMNGFQLMEKMANHNLDIPVIIMTGNASTASAVEALRRGAYDYLRKPFEPEELFSAVKNALNQRRLEEDNQRVKKQLRNSELHFKTLFNQAFDHIFIVDPAGSEVPVIVDANDAACSAYGYTYEEFIGKPFSFIETGDTAKSSQRALQLISEEQLVFESAHKRMDGTIFPVEISARMIKVGNHPLFYFITRNISGRKRACEIAREKASRSTTPLPANLSGEEGNILHELRVQQIELEMQNDELRRTQVELDTERMHYFHFYDLAPVGYITLSEKGIVLEANLTAANQLGRVRGAILNLPFSSFILREDQDIYVLRCKQLFKTGEPQVCELRMVKNNGMNFYAQLEAIVAQHSGEAPVCRIVISDITERKRAEAALRESEERFRRLAENAKDMIYRMSLPDGQYEYVSPASIDLLGYTPEEFYESRLLIQKIIHPNWSAYFQEQWKKLLSGEMPPLYEYQILHKSGEEKWLQQHNVLIRDDNGYPKAIEAIVSDITDRKSAEAEQSELEAQNRQLQKSESLSRMAGAIAHHFNNQLMVVTGNIELVIEDLPSGTPFVKNLTEAKKAAQKAAEVSSLMLTYLGQTTGKQAPMNIGEVCNRSLPLLQAALPKRIRFETHVASPGPAISGNVNQIQQMLANLIANAQEAAGNGIGAIELTVKTVSAAEIPVAHRFPIDWQPQDSAYACLEVADAGLGIAENDIEKIFDPFFTSKFIGRGLGLPVVIGILKTHRGAITVHSKPGSGSIFRVFLPVLPEKIIPPPEKVTPPFRVKRGTALLVEDEAQVRRMAALMLARLGFTVLEAGDGVEAVALFRQQKDNIRFVLCDMTMPKMNGWETLSALRKLSPGIPVVLSSGYNESEINTDDHPDRADAFLHKPFSGKELANVVRQVLPQECNKLK